VDADFTAKVPAEVLQARTLYARGVIRQIWHRTDVGGACILLEADSETHARELLNSLPMVQAGMLEVTVIPLKPYVGFCPPQ
jgi:muconolactone delta-isomerase